MIYKAYQSSASGEREDEDQPNKLPNNLHWRHLIGLLSFRSASVLLHRNAAIIFSPRLPIRPL